MLENVIDNNKNNILASMKTFKASTSSPLACVWFELAEASIASKIERYLEKNYCFFFIAQ